MEELLAEIAVIKQNYAIIEQKYGITEQENAILKAEIAKLKKLIFGVKSERYVPSNNGQLPLSLAGMEVQPQAPVNGSERETETIIRRKKEINPDQTLPVRGPIPADIPRERIEILPEGIDIAKAQKIGEVITEYLEYKPGKIYVKQIARLKYKNPEDGIIHIAELPPLPIPRSNVGPGLLANILVSKYVDHLPLYRQRKQFLRDGVDIAESTINGWVSAGCTLIAPLYDVLVWEIKNSHYIMADETIYPVLSADKVGSTHKGYYWAYHSPLNKLHCFEYNKSRSREGPDIFLKEFKGYLQSDGYNVYDHFGENKAITLLGCMAHARRYFHESLDQDKDRAEHVLGLIGKLYAIEQKARKNGMDAESRLKLRQEESVPVLKELELWFKEQIMQVLPKSAISKAIAYSLKIWTKLNVYVTDGNLEIDNNLVENKIRPIALGRKNYLFAGSHEAAQRAAMIYSFFATCQLHGINPQVWLTDILTRIGNYNIQNLSELLPHNWKTEQGG